MGNNGKAILIKKNSNEFKAYKLTFTIEGYRPGITGSVKRGITFDIDPKASPEDFLKQYKAALDELYEHERAHMEYYKKLNQKD